jgi:uncharacterized protein (TIGR02246 family)
MRARWGLLRGAFALIAGLALQVSAARAQLVDTPQNLIKAWVEAYGARTPDAMSRVYARDAHLLGLYSKEPTVGIDGIKRYYDRLWQSMTERSVAVTKSQILSRKRITLVSGTMEFRSKAKDGTARKTPARFTMAIVRESRRQWRIVSHHFSPITK